MRARCAALNKAHAGLCRRLAYDFTDPGLLERALTHRSKSGRNYERLEFLGDSVLNFVVSDELYRRYPDLPEGNLTRLRATLVRQQTLASMARALDLGDCVELGSGELKSGGYDRDSILADTLEAVFGAVYCDGGLEPARRTILALYAYAFSTLDPRAVPKDPKTRLQEYLQQRGLPLPSYHILEVTGEPHNQRFVVECRVEGLTPSVRGEGASRRRAEQQAAADAFERLAQKP
jgi:ribonuclease-3